MALGQMNIHIGDMGKYYLMLTTFLRTAIGNIPDLMAGNLLPFEDVVEVKKYHIYPSLISSSST